MGTSGSTCAETPVRAPYNRHLSNALDPRSPSAGIVRTPIEVLSSPSPDRADAESEEEEEEELATATATSTATVGARGSSGPSDPRSPTPGVNRTPFKISVTAKLNHLVRQLSGVFVSEEAEGHLPAERGDGAGDDDKEEEEGASGTAVDQLLDCEEEGGDGSELPTSDQDDGETWPAPKEMAAATIPSGTGPARPGNRPLVWTDSLPRGPTAAKRNPAPGKLPAPGTIRSPLQPLAGGNSPGSALGLRQIHKAAVSERIQDPEARSTMKAAPPDPAVCQDKENNYCLLTSRGRLCPP
ncbi:cell division cycle-associated protein 3 isoform X2 [Rhincodon typus]|uniref:cell division cycle-associated protein 3 isoform X2 n=1 Tax=Rhincodon typus TaxID=259920 RepID=UPI00202EDAD0|nr:cell division cycle-associated protein 3 isoform X2 [Rhincodon typus]